MRISTITCNRAENYGARLQAFALARYLSSVGADVQVIDYEPPYITFGTRLWYNPGLSLRQWAKLPLQFAQRRRDIAKHKALEDFMHSHVQLSDRTYHNIDDLRAYPPQSDIYIAGSDQIWNTDFANGRDPAFFLDFGHSSVRRISYAASFAIEDIPQVYRQQIAQWLSRFDAISVRESSALSIVNSLGYDAVQVCDPAFLLDASMWTSLAAPVDTDHQPYLLIYDFMRSAELRAVAERIARLRGLKIYSVSPSPLAYAHRCFCQCSPQQFVSLIKDADCVISNSLHGSIFSMIFGRDFYVVRRADGLNVRMSDMLSRYQLIHRIVDTSAPDSVLSGHIDYATVRPALDADIAESKTWISNALII